MPGLISNIFSADDGEVPETTMDLGVGLEGDLLSPAVTVHLNGTNTSDGGQSQAWDNATSVSLNGEQAIDM